MKDEPIVMTEAILEEDKFLNYFRQYKVSDWLAYFVHLIIVMLGIFLIIIILLVCIGMWLVIDRQSKILENQNHIIQYNFRITDQVDEIRKGIRKPQGEEDAASKVP